MLHARPWRETSLLIEAFSRGPRPSRPDCSRCPATEIENARTAPAVHSLAAVMAWQGRARDLERRRGRWRYRRAASAVPPQSSGSMSTSFCCGLFTATIPSRFCSTTIVRRSTGFRTRSDPEPVLRIFEKRLLQAVGYALELEREARSGIAIEPEGQYRLHYGCRTRTLVERSGPCPGVCVSGSTLLALSREQSHRPPCTQGGQAICMRSIIDEHCGGRALRVEKLSGGDEPMR